MYGIAQKKTTKELSHSICEGVQVSFVKRTVLAPSNNPNEHGVLFLFDWLSRAPCVDVLCLLLVEAVWPINDICMAAVVN